MSARALMSAAALVVGALASGCGGGAHLTHAEAVARGDEVCRHEGAALHPRPAQLSPGGSDRFVPQEVGRLLRSARGQADKLDRLDTSASDEARLEPIVSRLDDEADALDAVQRARDDGDTEAYRRALARARAADAAWRVQARDFGFEVCGT